MSTPTPQRNHYTTLSLPLPTLSSAPPSRETLRRAYRRALLKWHPDKADDSLDAEAGGPEKKADDRCRRDQRRESPPAVDDILLAYRTLVDPERRREYDRKLLLAAGALALQASRPNGGGFGFESGVETVDLDEFTWDEGELAWVRECAGCGDWSGCIVQERELEETLRDTAIEALEEGEVLVQCQGCSLWLRIVFGVAGDQDVEGKGSGR